MSKNTLTVALMLDVETVKALPTYAIATLIAIATKANPNYEVSLRKPIKEEISAEIGFTFSTVNIGIKHLRDLGLLPPTSHGEYLINEEYVKFGEQYGNSQAQES